ncbi:MAG: cytochrome b5 domain-containing protein [Spirochaetota bacterium]
MVVQYIVLMFALLASATAAEQTFSMTEISRHNKKSDCWILIDGAVYDVTRYLARHEDFEYDITKHCGTDSGALWHKKPETGKPHSRKANRLLQRYRIGAAHK